MSFIEALRKGIAEPDDIHQYIYAWHTIPGEDAIHDFLGMTLDEYQRWVQTGELPD